MDNQESHYIQPSFLTKIKGLAFRFNVGESISAFEMQDFYDEVKDTMFIEYPDVEMVGVGSESIVIGDPQNSDRILVYEHTKLYENPMYLQEKYHIHNILHILFPQNFPFVYDVDVNVGLTIRERIFGDKDAPPMDSFRAENAMDAIISKVKKSIGVDLLMDFKNANYIEDKNGNIYYVDFVDNEAFDFNIDEKTALEYFDQRYASNSDLHNIGLYRESLISHIKEIDKLAKINN